MGEKVIMSESRDSVIKGIQLSIETLEEKLKFLTGHVQYVSSFWVNECIHTLKELKETVKTNNEMDNPYE